VIKFINVPNEVNEFLQLTLIIPGALGPGVYSASNRNECQKQEQRNASREHSAAGCIGLTTSSPSVSRLSIQCGIHSTSQPYRPVTGIALLYQYVTVMKAFLPGTLQNSHHGLTVKQVAHRVFKFKLYCDRRSVGKFVLVSDPNNDQILIFFVWQLLYSSCRAPSLTRERVCNLQCNDSLFRVAQDP
jgi:hypothetical protein